MTQSAPAAGRVPARIAASWGVGTFATTTMLNGVSVVLLYFLVSFVKVEPVIAGAMLFGSKLLDVITDPPMGLISDRTHGRLGRRRPYLLGASLFCGLAFALLFNVPQGFAPGAVYTWVAVALVLYAISYTVFQVPYLAMPAEMTDDYHERTRIMTWRVVFMTIGNLAGAVGAPALVRAFGDDRAAYGEMGLTLGAVISIAMLVTFFGTAGARTTERDAERAPLAAQLRLLARNQPLLVLMATKVVLYAGIASFTTVMLFFFSNVLQKGTGAVVVYGLAQALTTIAFTPVCAAIGRRVEKKPAYIVCLLGFVASLLTWLAATPAEPMWLVGLRGVVTGTFAAGMFLYSQSMLVDTFAWDYRLSGLRREGVLAAAFGFVEKFSLALGPLLIGGLLSAMGFDKDLAPGAPQPGSAQTAMIIGFVWIPCTCQLIAVVLLRWYRLERADLAAPLPATAP